MLIFMTLQWDYFIYLKNPLISSLVFDINVLCKESILVVDDQGRCTRRNNI